MIVYSKEVLPQGSEAWFSARRGRPTASRFSDFMTPAKGDLSANAVNFALELIAECFYPEHSAFFGTPWTERGVELEPEARDSFAQLTGLPMEEVGFVLRDDKVVGCSPDSLIKGADVSYFSGVEIKVPSPKTHVRYVHDGVLPAEYRLQVHGSMAVTGLSEWHFFSYSPGVRPFHLLVKRDAFTAKISDTLDSFLILYAQKRAEMMPKLQQPAP